ncbi:hypothetical protein, variant 3 [Aphanomyces invadans]|uniref:Uncharacterized protein n=1 Tax=Aphanomyces invadans TaxID=157072 RepID=A0A024TC39_9STRA|nr:hypothetical protein, variant 2 [Aphanomyces invadans]XP_008880198.1 hypothetical protein, variant 3 [Aphanomyces invadans]ETV91166.1 hypothetical protein, variant 2 [Aphanomyces invadans]ETV91167.1 hypothetical protein, variant 3 [Aphanomyces invadans]|eukprot:XP_008880196.1 hypothetical protein, variant 2 [Aphanomyces invadans]
MAGEGSSSWPAGWSSSLEEDPRSTRRSREGEDDVLTRSTSPSRRSSANTILSRPSTSTADILSMRRFQLHEPDEKVLHQQRQQEKQRWRQLLDEQIQEKARRKAKEEEEKRIAEEAQAQLERQQQRQQHLRAQQKLGHVASLPNPPKQQQQQQQRYVSSGGSTNGLSIYTSPTVGVSPPPVPFSSRVVPSPTSSSSSRGISSRHETNNSHDVLHEVQGLLSELRYERAQMQVERQQMQLEREAMMLERVKLDHERGKMATPWIHERIAQG